MIPKGRRLRQIGLGIALTSLMTSSLAASEASPRAFAAQASPKPLTPLVITRVHSSSVVYVLATTGCSRTSCLRFVRTTVSAAKFTSVILPPLKALKGRLNFNLDSVQFANVDDGYAIVGEDNPTALYVTLDGAKSWHRVTIQGGTTIMELSVTTNALYAITGLCSPSGDTCRDYRLARSSLDAQHWVSQRLPGSALFDGTGWGFFGKPGAFGSNVWISEQPRGAAVIYFSHNGGKSFKKVTLTNLLSVAGCSLTAESARSLWAECPTGMQVSFAFSDDAGASWIPVHQNQFFGTGGGNFDPVTGTLAFLEYGGTAPLVRFAGSAREATKVGVLSCSTINSSIGGGDMVFTNESDGMALCQPEDGPAVGRLEITGDGGHTWERVTVVPNSVRS
jgi:hypothetical protein